MPLLNAQVNYWKGLENVEVQTECLRGKSPLGQTVTSMILHIVG